MKSKLNGRRISGNYQKRKRKSNQRKTKPLGKNLGGKFRELGFRKTKKYYNIYEDIKDENRHRKLRRVFQKFSGIRGSILSYAINARDYTATSSKKIKQRWEEYIEMLYDITTSIEILHNSSIFWLVGCGKIAFSAITSTLWNI